MKQNKINLYFIVITLVTGLLGTHLAAQAPAQLKSPEDHFGFKPGTDRMLINYKPVIDYLKQLDAASPRLKMVEIGKSPKGAPIYIAFISAKENIDNLDTLKDINRRLALDSNIPDEERKEMIKKGRVFLLGALSMHSGEVGPAQSSPLIAYQWVATTDPLKLEWLKNVVYMMVPCHNPDGMDMVVNHYKKYKGTKYEGSSMPGVYHKYIGHDNNRDFVTLSQADTRVISRISDLDWFPQVMVEKHQMGQLTARYFVPPFHDPIAENVDAGIWNWTGIFGSNMNKDMAAAGLAGVSQNYLFDNYWPGSTETSSFKNVISFLTEAASARYASPVFIEPNELQGWGKGLSDYKKSANMTLPWPGGWWRLSDIVQYEIVSTQSMIKTASLHRSDILRFRNDLCRKEVINGKTKPPYHYIVPMAQHDKSAMVKMINLLKLHGVKVYRLTNGTVVNRGNFKKGDIVIPLSQPFRPFVKEVMEAQHYPVRHYTPGGEIIKPYDVTSWSLPLHRGVTSFEINNKEHLPSGFDSMLQKIEGDLKLTAQAPGDAAAALFTVNHNESYKAAFKAVAHGFKVHRLKKDTVVNNTPFPAGSFVVYGGNKKEPSLGKLVEQLEVAPTFAGNQIKLETAAMTVPRIALVETWFHDMDAGWTRFIFDTYGIPFTVVRPGDFEKTDFTKRFDVVVFPNSSKSILMKGQEKYRDKYYPSDYPPEYRKGIGAKGLNRLLMFLDGGGIIVSWGESAKLFLGAQEISVEKQPKEEFQLPIEDITGRLKKEGLYCPGSLMKLDLLKGHPIAMGLPGQVGVFFDGGPVFGTSIPLLDMDRRVIGKFPGKDILLSGYCENQEKAGNKSVLVWLKKNKGQLVLFGFNPQYRGATQGTYKLLFNAILLPPVK
ncbi:MAG: hypothetical protein GY940_25865 [bacterium]|nr:hypothetical protein [bacterium]